jgi:hypothetical protein
MKYKSAVYTQASGSLNGITYSHNKGGPYTRARAIPTNPNSPQQQAVRGIFSDLAVLWNSVLDGLERATWDAYAFNVPIINKLGDPMKISGLNQFIRSNTPRIQAGLDQVVTGPTEFNIGSFTNPSFAIDAANDEVDVTFDDADAWANEDDSAMLVYAGRPVSPSINFFKGPYRLAGIIAGDAVTAPTSPAAVGLPFAVVAGQRVFLKVVVSRADGRLSYPFRGFGDAS